VYSDAAVLAVVDKALVAVPISVAVEEEVVPEGVFDLERVAKDSNSCMPL
jgi:hypothetical protein